MVKSLFVKSITDPAKMETIMIQPGFFDLDNRLRKIDSNGDPLTKIEEVVDWEIFRGILETVRKKCGKFQVGPRGFNSSFLADFGKE